MVMVWYNVRVSKANARLLTGLRYIFLGLGYKHG